ncbi:hypothetical protein ER308_15035 [Egibacter rhizosphaerae]|uniref:Uncharacterized protein n=1 Tax=Egibacter rhizosphaerae TaxID=1670831 RepID=A0A411YI03_9ACTN|nr:hypothetical protein ER308_15035 [Egibacter rhizosphaerae]
MRVHVFDADTFGVGQESLEVAPGEFVAVYGAVRSVVDALRLRHQIGTDLAYGALRHLLGHRRAAAGEVMSTARALRCATPAAEALEVLQA